MNIEQGRKLAPILYNSFNSKEIFNRNDMPEDELPKGVAKGDLDHLLFLTLSVCIDYQRNADTLWDSSRRTFEDPETRYLFNPGALHETASAKIIQDMQRYKLAKKMRQDAWIWETVGVSFLKKWKGDPRNFLIDCNWEAPTILTRLKQDQHIQGNKNVWDFPFLRGDKIGPLWLRMLRDNAGISQLKNMNQVPIPVDIHIARASLSLGVVQGEFNGKLTEIFPCIREAWAESVKGLAIRDRPMIALDLDEPLWHLSKYGCIKRNQLSGACSVKSQCIAEKFCMAGKISISNNNNWISLKT